MPPRRATTLENELALAARFGHRIILTIPSVEFAGETGKAVGQVGPDLNVAFTNEQAGRMYERLLSNRQHEGSYGETAD